MKTSRIILFIVIVIVSFALVYIIIKLKKPADNTAPSGPGPINTGSGSSGTANSSSGTGNNPPPPQSVDWTSFNVGDRVFAVLATNAYDRDIFGYHGEYAHALQTFAPGSYIGTVRSVIQNHGLMVSNTSVSNSNLGDPFFINGINGAYRKG